MLLGESELKKIADRVLAASTAEQTEALLFASHSALTRFANSYIHQNVEQKGGDISGRAAPGARLRGAHGRRPPRGAGGGGSGHRRRRPPRRRYGGRRLRDLCRR